MNAHNNETPSSRLVEGPRYIRLINLTNRMFVDSLRKSILTSIEIYINYFEHYANHLKLSKFNSSATNQSENTSNNNSNTTNANNATNNNNNNSNNNNNNNNGGQYTPILKIKILFENGKLRYSPTLEEFEQSLSNLITDLIDQTQKIHSLEVPTIDQKFYSERLVSVRIDEPIIQQHLSSLKNALNILILIIYLFDFFL